MPPRASFGGMVDYPPACTRVLVAAEEDVEPALDDLWQDVTAAFHDDDAHHLYVSPEAVRAGLDARTRVRLTSVAGEHPLEFHAQAADTAARSVRDAEPELERLVRSGYRTVVAWPRRGDGERAAFNLDRVTPACLRHEPPTGPGLSFAVAPLLDGFIAAGLQLAVIPA